MFRIKEHKIKTNPLYMPEFNLISQVEINIPTLKERKKRAKKEVPKTLKEVMRLDMEQVAFNKEVWLSVIRYVTDCFYDGDEIVIRVVDLMALNTWIAEYVIKINKFDNSRLVARIEEQYRVKINKEDFYEHNRPKEIKPDGVTSSKPKREFDWREFRRQEIEAIKRSSANVIIDEGNFETQDAVRRTFFI